MAKSIDEQVRDYIDQLKAQGRSAAIDYFLAQDFETQKAMVKLYQDLPVDLERQITESNSIMTMRRTGTDFIRFLEGANNNRIFQSFGHDRAVIDGGNDNIVHQGNPGSKDKDMAYMQGGERNWVHQAGGDDYAQIAGGKDGKLEQGRGKDSLEISGGLGYTVRQQSGADSLALVGGSGHTIYQDHFRKGYADVLRVDAITGTKGVGTIFNNMFPGSYGELTATLGTGPTNNKVYQGGGSDTLYMDSWAANGNLFSGDSSFKHLWNKSIDTMVIKADDVANLSFTKKGDTLSITYTSSISGTETTNTFKGYEKLKVGDQTFDVADIKDTGQLVPLSNVVQAEETKLQKG
ncbi:MAG: hypothetical protein MRY32_00675 [Rickettsiales bacterium]|nr:hypothetical protein [Rickettsiales bacterium]